MLRRVFTGSGRSNRTNNSIGKRRWRRFTPPRFSTFAAVQASQRRASRRFLSRGRKRSARGRHYLAGGRNTAVTRFLIRHKGLPMSLLCYKCRSCAILCAGFELPAFSIIGRVAGAFTQHGKLIKTRKRKGTPYDHSIQSYRYPPPHEPML